MAAAGALWYISITIATIRPSARGRTRTRSVSASSKASSAIVESSIITTPATTPVVAAATTEAPISAITISRVDGFAISAFLILSAKASFLGGFLGLQLKHVSACHPKVITK